MSLLKKPLFPKTVQPRSTKSERPSSPYDLFKGVKRLGGPSGLERRLSKFSRRTLEGKNISVPNQQVIKNLLSPCLDTLRRRGGLSLPVLRKLRSQVEKAKFRELSRQDKRDVKKILERLRK